MFKVTAGILLLTLAGQHVAAVCRDVLSINTGNLTLTHEEAPNPYSDYTFCRYVITGPENTRAKATITSFDLETSPGCTADSLKIFDLARPNAATNLDASRPCVSNVQPSFGPLCGSISTLPVTTFTSKKNVIAVEFCTDYAITGTGFSLDIQYEPLDTVVAPSCPWPEQIDMSDLSTSAVLSSPNFPQNYVDGQICKTTIKTNQDYALRVDIRDLNLGQDCGDVLNITAAGWTTMLCGRTFPTMVRLAKSEEITIEFFADEWDAYKGFKIEFSYELCPPGQLACDNGIGCANYTNHCDGVAHCADNSDEKPEYCAPDCGVPNFPVIPEKIVGGLSARMHSLPWQVAMLRAGGSQFCGASLISDQWIVSAAHCFTDPTPSRYKARIGGNNLNVLPEEEGAIIEDLEKVICHPYYRQRSNYDYDHCLLKLRRPIKFRKNIAPVCLPRQGSDVLPGTGCIVSGWGNTPPNRLNVNRTDIFANRGTQELRQVIVPVVDRQACNTSYSGAILDTMICAGLPEGGKDSCQGDSGGPFVCPNSRDRWVLDGIVSWGNGCARPNLPGVYARTGAAVDWMINTIAANS